MYVRCQIKRTFCQNVRKATEPVAARLIISFEEDPEAGFACAFDPSAVGQRRCNVEVQVQFRLARAVDRHVRIDVLAQIGPGTHSGISVLVCGHIQIRPTRSGREFSR